MDSYGIHASQIAADTAAQHVADINRAIQAHNLSQLGNFKKELQTDKSTTTEDKYEDEGLAAKAVVGVGSAIASAAAFREKYGGLAGALTRGTSENVYNLTGGLIGSGARTAVTTLKAGPEELATRAAAAVMGGPQAAFADIRSAQLRDVYAGNIKPSELSDPKQGLVRGGEMVAPQIEGSELGITGKIISKGLQTTGTAAGTAARLGAVGEGVVGIAGAGYTLYSDIAEGNWQKEGSVTKAGDVLSIAGGVLGTAAAAVPLLAPVAALTSLAGSIVDAIGDHEDNVQKQASDLQKGPGDIQQIQTTESTAGQIAQQAKTSSLQSLSGRGSGSF
jgi:hypothetical protein